METDARGPHIAPSAGDRTARPQQAPRRRNPEDPRFAVGDLIGGRYRVRRFAVGGIGEVYFCLDESAGTAVALKTLQARFLPPTERNLRLRRRLAAEAAIWSSLGAHPNIVRCFYFTTIGDAPFLALEWIADPDRSNVSLHRLVANRRGPLDPRHALRIAIEICRGLVYIGERQPNFVHRDLKVENVLMSQSGVAKLTDFGFSSVEGGARLGGAEGATYAIPRPDQVVGTPSTMAPEQWRRGVVDVRADIYALGCILFRMLAGHGPFKGEVREDYRIAHLESHPPPFDTDVPESLAQLTLKCLEKARRDRYQSMPELLATLEALQVELFGEPFPPVEELETASIDVRINRANTYYSLSHFGEAQREFEAILAEEPAPMAIYGRALACHARGLNAEAFDSYAEFLALRPDHAAAYYNRANLYRAEEDDALALVDYDRAIALDPSLAEPWNNRGLLHLEAGQRDEAMRDFDEAIARGALRAARRNRAALLLEENRVAEASDDVEALAGEPDATAQDFVNRARVRHQLGSLRGALDDYTTALVEGAGPAAKLHCERATIYRELGRLDDAIEDLSTALQLDRDLLDAYRMRAQIWHGMKKRVAAAGDYASLLERQPEDAGAYYGLGLLLGEERGRFDEAVAFLTEAATRGHAEAEAALAAFRSRGWIGANTTPMARRS